VIYGGGLVGLAMIALWVWAIFDVITADESLCRNLPKSVWLMVVIFLPTMGALAWLIVGRPEGASFRPGDPTPRSNRWDPRLDARLGSTETERERLERERREWMAQMDSELDRRIEERERAETERLRQWESELEQREAALREREQEQ
jgi:hypothetical protein